MLRSVMLPFVVLAAFVTGTGAADEWIVAKAAGRPWLVSRVEGQVEMRRGMPIAPGTTVTAQPGARDLLVSGENVSRLAPNTSFIVPFGPQQGMDTTVLHQQGRISGRVLGDEAEIAVREASVSFSGPETGETREIGRGDDDDDR